MTKYYKGKEIAGKVSDLHKGIGKMLGRSEECQCENCKSSRETQILKPHDDMEDYNKFDVELCKYLDKNLPKNTIIEGTPLEIIDKKRFPLHKGE
jgi:hypothetical protein